MGTVCYTLWFIQHSKVLQGDYKMISPAQVTLERAESEIRRRKKEHQTMTKGQKIGKQLNPYLDCLIILGTENDF